MFEQIKKPISWLIIISFALLPVNSYAVPAVDQLPTGLSGPATEAINGNTMDINLNTPNSTQIISHSTFSIGQDARVNINNGASGKTLDRVTSGSISEIYGSLYTQGEFSLVNTSGIIFGPNSSVDTAGLIASTLDITDGNFKDGIMNFSCGEGCGSVINQGNILAQPGGYVALLGSRVENTGTIIANTGKIALGAGEAMTISLDPGNLISIVSGTKTNLDTANAAVINTGTLSAKGDQGEVLLTAEVLKDAFDNAINNSGIVEAETITMNAVDGDIVLDGAKKVTAESTEGATVNILADDANIDINDSLVSATIKGSRGGNALVDIQTTEGLINIDPSEITASVVEGEGNATVRITNQGGDVNLAGNSGQYNLVEASVDNQGFTSGEAKVDIYAARGDVNITDTDVSAQIGDGTATIEISAKAGGERVVGGNVNILDTDSIDDMAIQARSFDLGNQNSEANVGIAAVGGDLKVKDAEVFALVEQPWEEGIADGDANVNFISVAQEVPDVGVLGGNVDLEDTHVLSQVTGEGEADVYFDLVDEAQKSEYPDKEQNLNITDSVVEALVGEGHAEIAAYDSLKDLEVYGFNISEMIDDWLDYNINGPIYGSINIFGSTLLAKAATIEQVRATALIGLAAGEDINITNSTLTAEEDQGEALIGLFAGNDINLYSTTIHALTNGIFAGVGLFAENNLNFTPTNHLLSEANDFALTLGIGMESVNAYGSVDAQAEEGVGISALLSLGDVYAANVSASGGDMDVIDDLLDPLLDDWVGITLGDRYDYSSLALIGSLAGDVTLGDITADMVLGAALGLDEMLDEVDTGEGSIYNADGDISANFTYFLARNHIGNLEDPIATDTNIIAGYSFDTGNIFIDQATGKTLEVGLFLPVNEKELTSIVRTIDGPHSDDIIAPEGGEGDYYGPLGFGASLAAKDGIISVTSEGDQIIHSIISANGGVFLQSREGSIYAGIGWDPSVDGEDLMEMFGESCLTSMIQDFLMPFPWEEGPDYLSPVAPIWGTYGEHSYNVIAAGYSYFSTPNGTIGVGTTPESKDPDVSGQVVGNDVDPLVTTINGNQAVSLDLRFGVPPGYVTYNGPGEEGPGPMVQVWPEALPGDAGAQSLENPLYVAVETIPEAHSVLPLVDFPEGEAAGLTLQIGNEFPPPPVTETPYLLEDKTIRDYYEILDVFRLASFEPATPTTYYAYHPLTPTNTAAFDNIRVDAGAYEFIDGALNATNPLAPYFGDDAKKKKE